jgi:lipopolysaccharide biosynthesis glycosyltransferase
MKVLATVTSKSYLEGTKVLFQSFLLNNRDFDGDLVVIHHELSLQDQEELSNLFHVKFHKVSDQLESKVKILTQEYPFYENKYQRFWSIEAFNLGQYEQVLFLDSDVLCTGKINHLFTSKASFSACPDIIFYENKVRDAQTYIQNEEVLSSSNALSKSFNSGVFFIDSNSISERAYQDLLDLLTPSTFKRVKSGHTDQFLLNTYFRNKVNWLDVSYNYYMNRVKLLSEKTNTLPAQALLLHYIRHPKPWKHKYLIKQRMIRRGAFYNYNQWHSIYRSILKIELKGKVSFKKMGYLLASKILFP